MTLTVVENTLAAIREAMRQQGLECVIEPTENPNVFVIGAIDDKGRENAGLVGWSEKDGAVCYFAHDPIRANHNAAEGVPLEDAIDYWDAKTEMFFIAHLDGTVRDLSDKWRTLMQKSIDLEDQNQDN